MTDFQRQERARAFARTMEHLNQALAHLQAAAEESRKFDLGVEVPPQKPITDAMNQCAHVYKQPGETHA